MPLHRDKPVRKRESPSGIAFFVGMVVVLVLLAIVSIATGLAPVSDPIVFPPP
jgi:hypothetical protein